MDATLRRFWMDAILAGGFNKTVTLAGSESPNRVVILQFANMDALKAR